MGGRRVRGTLQAHWWRQRPTLLTHMLRPLAGVYRALWTLRMWRYRLWPAKPLSVPVVVVGNLVVGGAGKTPTVIALVGALQAAGRRVGVISRGYAGQSDAVRQVRSTCSALEVGDEPLLIQRRTQAPVFVGRHRHTAAQALLAAHPQVDVIVSDDGLQHLALPRGWQLLVFDGRGVGNGLLLPAGPLRQPLPAQVPPRSSVLYNADLPSTPLAGFMAARAIHRVWPLQAWLEGAHPQAAQALPTLRGRTLLAAAGIAEPERFFRQLEEAGLSITRCPLPDHHPFHTLPWPANTPDVVVTEKDAVKLGRHVLGVTRVWVAALDFSLPRALVEHVLAQLSRHHDR